jgi:hypothetical protein
MIKIDKKLPVRNVLKGCTNGVLAVKTDTRAGNCLVWTFDPFIMFEFIQNKVLYVQAKLPSHLLLHLVKLCLKEMHLYVQTIHPIMYGITISKQFAVHG